jgi:hypothetical protein
VKEQKENIANCGLRQAGGTVLPLEIVNGAVACSARHTIGSPS